MEPVMFRFPWRIRLMRLWNRLRGRAIPYRDCWPVLRLGEPVVLGWDTSESYGVVGSMGWEHGEYVVRIRRRGDL